MHYSNRHKNDNFFNRNPKKTTIVFVFLIFLILFLLVEIFLRLNGEKAGIPLPSRSYVKSFDNIKVYNSFFTDDEGIFKANKNYDWSNNRYGENVTINSEGFRSIEFKNYTTHQIKILFLGDSYTWGASAKPIQNCFADLVSREGYLTFNTGIPGTGPIQYAYLANKYIPLLKPDVVAVMFCMGNDLQEAQSLMLPNKNIWYITNAGWLYAFDEAGNYLSIEESFYHHYYQYYSRQILKNKIKYIVISTVIGKKMWLFLRSIKHQKSGALRTNQTEYPTDYLTKIKKISEQYGARFLLFIIPAHPHLESRMNRVKDKLQIFRDFHPFVPNFLTIHDYMELPDAHLNNSGHKKFSKFILNSLQKELIN